MDYINQAVRTDHAIVPFRQFALRTIEIIFKRLGQLSEEYCLVINLRRLMLQQQFERKVFQPG